MYIEDSSGEWHKVRRFGQPNEYGRIIVTVCGSRHIVKDSERLQKTLHTTDVNLCNCTIGYIYNVICEIE